MQIVRLFHLICSNIQISESTLFKIKCFRFGTRTLLPCVRRWESQSPTSTVTLSTTWKSKRITTNTKNHHHHHHLDNCQHRRHSSILINAGKTKSDCPTHHTLKSVGEADQAGKTSVFVFLLQDHWDERRQATTNIQAVPANNRRNGTPGKASPYPHPPGGNSMRRGQRQGQSV